MYRNGPNNIKRSMTSIKQGNIVTISFQSRLASQSCKKNLLHVHLYVCRKYGLSSVSLLSIFYFFEKSMLDKNAWFFYSIQLPKKKMDNNKKQSVNNNSESIKMFDE